MSSSKFITRVKSLAAVSFGSGLFFSGMLFRKNDESFFENFAMPLSRLFFNPETIQNIWIFLCKWNLQPRNNYEDPPSLSTNLCGVTLKNVIGIAAGFDKNAEALKGLDKLGFGFVEVGTVIPEEQEGLTKPRMFILNEDNAIIHRTDGESKGHSFTVPKMRSLRRREEYKEIIGFNIGKNLNTDIVKDISLGVKVFSPVANYLVINLSYSPDTPYDTELMKDNLRKLLREINTARLLFDVEKQRPIFLKLSPDFEHNELKSIVDVTKEKNCKIHGFIISNSTSNDRDINLQSKYREEKGGLSGKPLKEKSTEMIKDVYKLTNGKMAIIGVGGISTGEDAYEKILAGASAVQIYSSFIYQGPPVIIKIKRELNELLLKNGYENVSQAVGKNVQLDKRRFRWLPFLR